MDDEDTFSMERFRGSLERGYGGWYIDEDGVVQDIWLQYVNKGNNECGSDNGE